MLRRFRPGAISSASKNSPRLDSNMKDQLVIGSRGSKLALTQAGIIKSALEALDSSLVIRIEVIKTSGDVKTDPLSAIGGQGVFTKELEDALLDGRIDIAVHSLKDLPTIIPAELTISAICKREDPRDALVLSRNMNTSNTTLEALPGGATIGTSSPRRLARCSPFAATLFLTTCAAMSTRGCASSMKANMMPWSWRVRACAGSGLRVA